MFIVRLLYIVCKNTNNIGERQAFVKKSGCTNEPQQQQAVAKLDYRWFVTFDNYLRKKEQIIIKIDGN